VARDEPLGLETCRRAHVESLGAERLGRVGSRCPFHDLSVGETASPDYRVNIDSSLMYNANNKMLCLVKVN
jgi:hypothetical protein